MRLSENRKLAWVVLAVCVFGSVVGLGGGHLVRERGSVEERFYSGSEEGGTRESMDAYLDRAYDCAQVMASEAQLHFGTDDAAAAQMLDTLESFRDEAGLDARYAAYTELQTLSDQLYNEFYADGVADADRVNFKRAYDDFWGADKFVRRDAYRSLARDFNDSMKGFPASAVAGLMGVDELNSFGA